MNIRRLVESKLFGVKESVQFRGFNDNDYDHYSGVDLDSAKIIKARDSKTEFNVDIVVDDNSQQIHVFCGRELDCYTTIDADEFSREDLIKIGQLVEDGQVSDAWSLINQGSWAYEDDEPSVIESWLEEHNLL